MKKLDLHGIKHQKASNMADTFIRQNKNNLPIEIITGNSLDMQNIIKRIIKFTKKLNYLQKRYNFFLIGGDLSKSNKIIISSNFFGFAPKGKILNRIGAKINDDIWVTGNLGESSIGLAIKQKKIRLKNNG